MERRVSVKHQIIAASVILGITLLIVTIASCYDIVRPGNAGVIVRLGQVQNESLPEGLHYKRPFVDTIEVFDITVQKHEITAQAGSKDLQQITTMIAVNHSFNPQKIPEIRRKVGYGFQLVVLEPAIHESVKAVVAQYDAEELLTKRAEVRDKMEVILRKKLNIILKDAFVVNAFNVIDFDFSKSFNTAIENKQVAEQKAEQSQNEIIQQKAEAQKKIEQARGEAESIELKAKARAAAIEIEAAALAKNPQILLLRKIEKWDGRMPRVVTGEASSEILLSIPAPANQK